MKDNIKSSNEPPPDYTDKEILEIQKDFFLEVLANTLVKDQPKACVDYITLYHHDDRRLMRIADVLRGARVQKARLPWATIAPAEHYIFLFETEDQNHDDALENTANYFGIKESAVKAAVTAYRKYYSSIDTNEFIAPPAPSNEKSDDQR